MFIMFCVMVTIPDQSGRVRRLREYERELNHKLAFDSKFAEDLSKRQSVFAGPMSSSVVRRMLSPGSADSSGGIVVDDPGILTTL